MAQENFIEGKLKVLEAWDDITHCERRFVITAHQYRNELYHVGLTHDEIIRSISYQYFKLCCQLFERLKPGWRTQSSTDRFTEVAERYLPTRNGRVDFMSVDNTQLAKKILENLPKNMPPLQVSLSTSARDKIENIKKDFDFVVQDNPGRQNEEAVLRNVQWQLDFSRALQNEGVHGTWMDPGYIEEVHRVRTTLEETSLRRHTSVPASRWFTRAEAIFAEPDPLHAMNLYQSLRNDMAYLEEAITTAAVELDAWIQLEVDRARGK